MHWIKPFIFSIIGLLISFWGTAQNPTFDNEMAFMQHLVTQNQYNNVLLLGQQLKSRFTLPAQQNRLALEMGLAHHYLKTLDSAAYYFEQVTPTYVQYDKACFYQSLDLAYLKRYKDATQALQKLPTMKLDSFKTALHNFHMAGLALLSKNYQRFGQRSLQFTFQHPAFASQERKLLTLHEKLQKIPKRSAFVAGLFSSIIPGTGKMYAGSVRQGLNVFLQNLFLGAQAVEALLKDGVTSPRFIIFGGLFSIFYLGNIWGSALSVKLKQREAYDTIHNEILFNLDVPLRLVFR